MAMISTDHHRLVLTPMSTRIVSSSRPSTTIAAGSSLPQRELLRVDPEVSAVGRGAAPGAVLIRDPFLWLSGSPRLTQEVQSLLGAV